jgi:hypothetical protein
MAKPLTKFERSIFLNSAFATQKVSTLATQLNRIKRPQAETVVQHIYLLYLDSIYNNPDVREDILLARKHLNIALLGFIYNHRP